MITNAERVLGALGDPTRRAVFKRLRTGALSVKKIADGMAVSRPAVSQRLKVLEAAGLVAVGAEGTRRLYAIDMHGVETLRNWLDGFRDKTLAAYKAAAEQEAANRRKPQ